MKKDKLIMSIVTAFCLSVASVSIAYAWFTGRSTNSAQFNNIKVDSGVNMQISTDGVNYYRSLDIDFEGLKLVDITGDGSTFYRPVFTLEEGQDEHGIAYDDIISAVPVISGVNWAVPSPAGVEATPDAYEGKQYISMTLYFKSDRQMDIYLCGNSSIIPNATTRTSTNPAEIDNVSQYGNFTRDYIAGAARVAFFDADDNLKLIWVPNTSYELSYSTNSNWTMNENGTSELEVLTDAGYYYYGLNADGTAYEKKYLNDLTDADTGIPKIYTGTLPDISFSSVTVPSNAATIASMEEDVDGNYVAQCTLVLWIEGCDRESRRPLAGGEIQALLNFVGIVAAE